MKRIDLSQWLNKVTLGDALKILRQIPDKSVHVVVTSPPYWNLRDYGVEGQLGLEPTPEEFVQKVVLVFREVRRILRDDGTLWINIGDSYASKQKNRSPAQATKASTLIGGKGTQLINLRQKNKIVGGLKAKDMVGIPWKLAEALKAPFYTGVIKSETDRMWMAAMLDAEGSICGTEYLFAGKTKTNIYITITNSSTDIIDRCILLFPQEKRNVYEKGDKKNKTVYRWDVEKTKIKQLFICEIFPYLVAKKKQAIIAWNFLEMQKGLKSKKKGYLPAQQERRSWMMESLSKLNKGQDVDLPRWLQPVPSLYEEGFYLRQDVIWKKRNPMPESAKDRCTKAHEYIFMFAKSKRYFYDQIAIASKVSDITKNTLAKKSSNWATGKGDHGSFIKDADRTPGSWAQSKVHKGRSIEAQRKGYDHRSNEGDQGLRNHSGNYAADGSLLGNGLANKRSVWEIDDPLFLWKWLEQNLEPGIFAVLWEKYAKEQLHYDDVWDISTQAFKEAHFATFPEELPRLCILAGTSAYGVCADCGAPYQRVVKKDLRALKSAPKNIVVDKRDHDADAQDQGSNRAKSGHQSGRYYEYQTDGWEKTCACETTERGKFVVLDPFAGAGTTGLVAIQLGGDAIEIELSSDYKKINENRKRKTLGIIWQG
jgi:DNA modification methylase